MTDQVGTADTQLGVSEPISRSSANSDYYQQWLDTLASHLPSVSAASLYVPVDDTFLSIANLGEDSVAFAPLTEGAKQHFQSSQPQVTKLDVEISATGQSFGLYYPLLDSNQQLLAFIAVAVQVSSQQQLTESLSTMQWSVASLEVVEYQQRLGEAQLKQNQNAQAVAILARVLAEKHYTASAVRLVTELALLFHCDRVSLGRYNGRRSKLMHLSHSAQFGKKMNHVRLIERVMDECIDIGEVVVFDPNGPSQGIDQAQKALSSHLGNIGVLAIPLYHNGEAYGALVLEAQPEQRWSKSDAEHGQSIASLVLPALEDKRLNDRSWLAKTASSLTTQLKRLFGPRYLGRKLALIAIVAAGYGLATFETDYKLSADAQIESAELNSIVAPYDGYINQALVRAGDSVEQGQPLVLMDDKDLRLEKLKWLSEQSKLNRQYLEALSARDRAQINIINAQQQQVEAQLALLDSQLERGQLSAPYTGVVVSGDLSQRLGSAVSKGDLLLEVAPQGSYRIKLLVQESRIGDLELNQQGTLYLSALPEQGFEFTISKITSITESAEGATQFVVEAQLNEVSSQLQTGMEGIGKVDIDNRLAIEIWTRDLVEWARLQYWSWWG